MNNKIKVLVVDDEVEIQKSIGRYFSFFDDVEMLFASTYEEAVESMEKCHPRMYILDINLPDGNGLKLVKIIKQHSPANQVIMITGASDLNRVFEALESGANDYLTKPLDMAILRSIVSEAVERFQRWYDLIKLELQIKQKD
ncbi:MAG: response regulator [Candidatus Magnetomorum sp.]|nr:response regulator [Candidatus Magnetomorum sp.]